MLQTRSSNLKICVHGKQNPFDVGYLRYSVEATYKPPVVKVYVQNSKSNDSNSVSGTMYISIIDGTNTWSAYTSDGYAYIPSLKPGEGIEIPIYLKRGTMYSVEKYKDLNSPANTQSPLHLYAHASFNVPDIVEEAKKQGVAGTDPHRPDKYVWDKNPQKNWRKEPLIMMKKTYNIWEY